MAGNLHEITLQNAIAVAAGNDGVHRGGSFDGYSDEDRHAITANLAGHTSATWPHYHVGFRVCLYKEEETVSTYSVTYDANEGIGAPQSEVVMSGNYNIPNIIPIRDGYEFRGWRDGNSIYQPKGIIPVSNNVVLKAIWEINTYNVTLYANGGTFSGYSDEWVSRTYNHNEEINREDLVDEPIRNGYEFLGWSENHEATEQQYEKDIKINCTKDMELYAVWKEVTYIITYNANGGFGLEQSDEVVPGESVKLITNPYTRNGYQFLGWSTSSQTINAEYLAREQYTPTKSTILYAVWKKTTPDAEITPIKPVIPDAEIM